METNEIMENEEIMATDAEFEAEPTECSGGSDLGKGVLLGAALVGAGIALKKGFNKVKPIVMDKIAEHKAKKAEKQAAKSHVVIDEVEGNTK